MMIGMAHPPREVDIPVTILHPTHPEVVVVIFPKEGEEGNPEETKVTSDHPSNKGIEFTQIPLRDITITVYFTIEAPNIATIPPSVLRTDLLLSVITSMIMEMTMREFLTVRANMVTALTVRIFIKMGKEQKGLQT